MGNTGDDWLALREPQDHAARCIGLARIFAQVVGANAQIIDLGCGTGSNVRYLSPKLGAGQRWICLDHDPEVLAQARKMLPDVNVSFQRRDLTRELASLSSWPGAALTTSAFLDVTSGVWIDHLVELCREVPLLAALTFDGRIVWDPPEAEDAAILEQVLIHRRTDCGFGPALGPEAAPYLAEQLKMRSHRVSVATSDWRLGPDDRPLTLAMVRGIARRVQAMSSDIPIDHWLAIRERQLDAGELRLTVGHVDLLSIPLRCDLDR